MFSVGPLTMLGVAAPSPTISPFPFSILYKHSTSPTTLHSRSSVGESEGSGKVYPDTGKMLLVKRHSFLLLPV